MKKNNLTTMYLSVLKLEFFTIDELEFDCPTSIIWLIMA